MDLTKYKHIGYTIKPNKKKIPINDFTFENLEEFNSIYMFAKNNFMKVKPTLSRGISNKVGEKYHFRYFMNVGNQRFELVIICNQGCYRFVLHNRKAVDNTVGGRDACKAIYEMADKYNIDMSKYASEAGFDIKKEILSPHIQVMRDIYIATPEKPKAYLHMYHMDFNASYASRISEEYPELKPMYEEIYNMRKDNNDYYKHVLTNSIGCFQSEVCLDYESRFKSKPYQFAKLSKIAINNTRAKIEDKLYSLKLRGFVPVLTNTDGIWYFSNHGPYHDKEEGTELGQWKTDHSDCKFMLTGPGAYQFIENNVCHTVVRGICNLDSIEPDRSKWKFGDILKITEIYKYKFKEEEGVVKVYE